MGRGDDFHRSLAVKSHLVFHAVKRSTTITTVATRPGQKKKER
jgi:hypothetical protein